MPIAVTSACGKGFNLKDELAGKLVQCPECGEEIQVPGGAAPPAGERFGAIDPVFLRRKFLLRQKHLAISEKYYVWDEQGKSILFVERPAHLARNALAIFAAIGVLIGAIALAAVVSPILPESTRPILLPILVLPGMVGAVVVAVALSPRRHVHFYRDDSRRERLLQVDQDRKFMPIVATYTIRDASGAVLARLRKNIFTNFFRKRWLCLDPADRVLSVIKEDSLLLSLLRRVLGTFFGLLRVNFVFFRGETDDVIAEFNRAFTLLDRYVLDLSRDAGDVLDPRIALATGVMLDTGERR